jgi:ubiquinone/menaquinone biosynthesis C-methylase UbiE
VSINHQIISQFRQPHGFLGQIAGLIMANRPSNIKRNEWTVDLLDLKPTDNVLEIGFGPGIALKKVSRIVTEGSIVGIDHSETMLRQASKRNDDAIERGMVKLYIGNLNNLSRFNNTFDKIYSANVIQFWDDPKTSFLQLKDLLKTGGKIATTYMPRHNGATNADTKKKADEIVEHLWDAGFKNVQTEERQCGSVSATCVIAEK